MRQVAVGFVIGAGGALLLGLPEVAFFLSIAAGLLAILGPEDSPRRDARRRNQAHRVR